MKHAAANKVSIQQSLDGHSFSAPDLGCEFTGDGLVEVEILSARTMLVPQELFDVGAAEAILAANGMYPSSSECVVWSDAGQEIVAVMTVSKEATEAVGQKLGSRAAYTTPLLREPENGAPLVWCMHIGDLLYVKVYDDGLRFAEVVPAPTDTDVMYFFERLGQAFIWKNYGLQVEANNAKALLKQLKKRFK